MWPLAAVTALALTTGLAGSPAQGGATPVNLLATQDATDPPEEGTLPLQPADADQAPPVSAPLLRGKLDPLLADPALGPAPAAIVLDGATGATLVDRDGSRAATPASSLKVATSVAVLAAWGPEHRLTTSVQRNPDGSVVLVGGGDPTLRTVTADPAPSYPIDATLADLAEQTALALQSAGITELALGYDASLFSGPAYNADWEPSFVDDDIVMPVSALTVDKRSVGIDRDALEADPARATADWFAARLGSLGISVSGVAPGAAAPDAEVLAAVESPTIAALVDRTLDFSDNDVAEALFRLAALGRGLPGSFEGGGQAVAGVLTELGVPIPGLVVRDGSGLSRGNAIAPVTLATALLLASEPDVARTVTEEPDVSWAPAGLSVGGLTGTLANRFDDPATTAGAGRVQAKTGTLTGVTSLSGIVATLQGRPIVFSILGTETTNTFAARDALDDIAAAIAGCGCAATGG